MGILSIGGVLAAFIGHAGNVASLVGLHGQRLAEFRGDLTLATLRLTRVVSRAARVSELLWALSRSDSGNVRRKDLARLDELVGDVPPLESDGPDGERDQFYRVLRFQLDRFLAEGPVKNDRQFERFAAAQTKIADRLRTAAIDAELEDLR